MDIVPQEIIIERYKETIKNMSYEELLKEKNRLNREIKKFEKNEKELKKFEENKSKILEYKKNIDYVPRDILMKIYKYRALLIHDIEKEYIKKKYIEDYPSDFYQYKINLMYMAELCNLIYEKAKGDSEWEILKEKKEIIKIIDEILSKKSWRYLNYGLTTITLNNLS